MYGNAVATDGAVPAGGSAGLDQARRAARHDILAGESAVSALERYTAYADRELERLAAMPEAPATPVALIALGGYGRRHLCPYSDLDLLVLFGGSIGEPEERFLRQLLHPLWDAGYVVGHQIREAGEFAELEVDNPEFLMALLDARLVAGEASLYRQLLDSFQVPATRAHILEALQKLVDTRYARFNGTLYQLEPDVKEAPGALRDIAAARAIAAVSDPALLRRSRDAPRLAQAEEFLLRIRALLHHERRRNDNVLGHEFQETIAAQLKYPGQSARHKVEALMADYFNHARAVTRALDRARRTAPVPVGTNLGGTRDGVRFIDEGLAARHPESWLAAFQSAIDADRAVADETLEWIRQHGEGCSFATLFPTAAHRAALLQFLVPRRGLYARLSELHDCGLLGRMIPPFRAIACRVVRDFYHKYTVDEHTLQTIRNLERLAHRAGRAPPLLGVATRSGVARAAGAGPAAARRREVA